MGHSSRSIIVRLKADFHPLNGQTACQYKALTTACHRAGVRYNHAQTTQSARTTEETVPPRKGAHRLMDKIICGTGAQCEQTCPVMRVGRICPPLPEFIDELAGIYVTDPASDPQLEIQPA